MGRIGAVLTQTSAPRTTGATIGAVPPLTARDFFHLTTQFESSPFVSTPITRFGTGALDLLSLPFRFIETGLEQARRASEGRPLPPFRQALATELRGGEERLGEAGQPSRLESAAKFLLSAGLTQPLFAAPRMASRIGQVLRQTQPLRVAEEAFQARVPISVVEAERIVRSGQPPPGFAARLGRGLTGAQRQELAQRLGQVRPSKPTPRALPAPLTLAEGSGIVSEGDPPRYAQRQIAFGRELAPVRPKTALSPTALAQTHPGVSSFPANSSAPEVPVVPITRAEADQLLGQSVELRPGLLIQKAFRDVPPEASMTATGLQYWYKYDVPSSTGLRYPPRSVPTPSEALEVREPPRKSLRSLVSVRRRAVQVVTRQLLEQARILNQERLSLRRRVIEHGGIKPTLAGGLREELQAIRPFLRQGGQAIDDLATELGFENGEALREALIATQGARVPTLAQLRQQAIQVVDSEQGNRILEAIQAKGATGKAITAVVKDVTRQTQQQLAQGQRQVRGILTAAQRKAMTPAQLARFAREQRITQGIVPGAPRKLLYHGSNAIGAMEIERLGTLGGGKERIFLTPSKETAMAHARAKGGKVFGVRRSDVPSEYLEGIETGPVSIPQTELGGKPIPVVFSEVPQRGGVREAPLAPEEIAQIEQRVGGIVPRRPVITGQPPRIPRKKALVPAEFAQHRFRDLTEFQSTAGSGLDPRRAARLVDTQDFGPVRRFILDPAQDAARAGRATAQRDLSQLHTGIPRLRARTAESEQLFDLVEGKLPANQITPRLTQSAAIMRETYDRLLGDLNRIRASQGKPLIPRRDNYITHIQTLNLLDDFYYGLHNVPDDAIVIPNVQTHPNSPFFQFALRRLGGRHAKDAVEAFHRYVEKANAVIAHAPALQATRPFVQQLPPRAQQYFNQYLDEVLALRKPKADILAPRPLLSVIGWLRRQVGGGAVLGNLSSVINQLWTLPATVARTGPLRVVGAGRELLASTGKDIINRLVSRIGTRDYAQALLDLHKPDVRDFIEAHSPLLQNRRFEIEFDPKTMRQVDRVLGGLLQAVDQEMVRLAWLAQFRKSARLGRPFSQAVREAEETAFLTQSGYTPEDLPPAFRSQILGAFGQFQNSVNNVFNFLRFDVGIQPLTMAMDFRGHISRHPELFKQALLFVGTVLAMKSLYEHAGIPSAVDGPEDLVPLWGMAEYGPPAFWAPIDAGLSLVTADTPLEQAKAQAKLKRAAFLMSGRGGNQLRKTLDGIVAVSKGGKFDKRGRLLFPVSGTDEQLRALLFGIYGTKAGQAYIKRGFKPEPLTPGQRLIRRRLGELRRRLSPSVSGIGRTEGSAD